MTAWENKKRVSRMKEARKDFGDVDTLNAFVNNQTQYADRFVCLGNPYCPPDGGPPDPWYVPVFEVLDKVTSGEWAGWQAVEWMMCERHMERGEVATQLSKAAGWQAWSAWCNKLSPGSYSLTGPALANCLAIPELFHVDADVERVAFLHCLARINRQSREWMALETDRVERRRRNWTKYSKTIRKLYLAMKQIHEAPGGES